MHKTYECKFCNAVVQGYVQFRSHMKSHDNLKVNICCEVGQLFEDMPRNKVMLESIFTRLLIFFN